MELLFPGSLRGRRRFEVEFSELDFGSTTAVGPAAVDAVPVELPGTPACSLRVSYADRVVAYTGDTEWSDDLIGLAAGADLLIAEAYFFDRQVPSHLDYATLLAHRDQLSCKRVVLTHMSPDMLARQAEAEFECAYDGMVVEL
jgi:ribonuclease BN (tRNA processing enzyme)